MEYLWGLGTGLTIGAIIHLMAMAVYKRILRRKAADGSAECLGDGFYCILPEAEANEYRRWQRGAPQEYHRLHFLFQRPGNGTSK